MISRVFRSPSHNSFAACTTSSWTINALSVRPTDQYAAARLCILINRRGSNRRWIRSLVVKISSCHATACPNFDCPPCTQNVTARSFMEASVSGCSRPRWLWLVWKTFPWRFSVASAAAMKRSFDSGGKRRSDLVPSVFLTTVTISPHFVFWVPRKAVQAKDSCS